MNILDCQTAFAVPGSDTIIDHIRPDTGTSWCYGQTLEQIRLRYPGAEIVNVNEHCAAKGARQDGEPKHWRETTEDRYHEMLNVLPPAAWARGAFLVGEACDHHARTGKPRFTCFKQEHGKYYELTGHVTFREFQTMFGETSKYTYIE